MFWFICKVAYDDVLNDLKVQCQQRGLIFQPDEVMSDFESGLIPAIRQQFPGCRHRGCHFHFSLVYITFCHLFS
jgi:transposase-like protein